MRNEIWVKKKEKENKAKTSSVKTIVAYADQPEAEDAIMVGDISGAFNLADEYDDGIERFAIWQPVIHEGTYECSHVGYLLHINPDRS